MKIQPFVLSVIGMVVIIISSISTLSAQEKTTAELLQGKVWVMQFPDKVDFSFEVKFIANEYITIYTFEGKEYKTQDSCYLSNEEDCTFDKQKVGHLENGKYIIVNRVVKSPEKGSYNKITIFEILKLTDTELQLKNLRNNSILPYKSEEPG